MPYEYCFMLNASLETVWYSWTQPAIMRRWVSCPDFWQCISAENELLEGGTFQFALQGRNEKWRRKIEGRYSRIKTFREIHFSIQKQLLGSIFINRKTTGTEVIFSLSGRQLPFTDQQLDVEGLLARFILECEVPCQMASDATLLSRVRNRIHQQ